MSNIINKLNLNHLLTFIEGPACGQSNNFLNKYGVRPQINTQSSLRNPIIEFFKNMFFSICIHTNTLILNAN